MHFLPSQVKLAGCRSLAFGLSRLIHILKHFFSRTYDDGSRPKFLFHCLLEPLALS